MSVARRAPIGRRASADRRGVIETGDRSEGAGCPSLIRAKWRACVGGTFPSPARPRSSVMRMGLAGVHPVVAPDRGSNFGKCAGVDLIAFIDPVEAIHVLGALFRPVFEQEKAGCCVGS